MIISNKNIKNQTNDAFSDNISENIALVIFRKKSRIIIMRLFLLCLIALLTLTVSAFSARIKDIAVIEGAGGVQVIGYGLVTGLNQTGDNQSTNFTVQSVSNMLKRFGLTVPQTNPRVRNVAAVMVTALIPTFSRPGTKIDIQVSSIGDASSLQGGILLMTPVSRQNGSIIGMAQGAVSVGGYDYSALGSRVGKNTVTAGRACFTNARLSTPDNERTCWGYFYKKVNHA